MAKLDPDVIAAIQRQGPKLVKRDLDKEFKETKSEINVEVNTQFPTEDQFR